MSKKIAGSEFPLAKIFSSDFEYTIPSYQRPYAWTVEQASELFDDLYSSYISDIEDEYFLGSIVLIKEEGKPQAQVIDGQQRLTSLTILLATLGAHLKEGREDLKDYLVEPGKRFENRAANPRLSLRPRDQEFFHKYIQEINFDELLRLDEQQIQNDSQRNIRKNSEAFFDLVRANFTSDEHITKFVGYLMEKCYLITVSTPNEQSAFRVFSVMNSRGLDLQPTDIIKAEVIGRFDQESDRDRYSAKWEDLEEQLGRSEFNDLFSHIRMIFTTEKARRSLLEEFRNLVMPNDEDPQAFIDGVLEPYAEALHTLRHENYKATLDAQPVNQYIHWLNKTDNAEWVPAALLFLTRQGHQDDALEFFSKLERLAGYLYICSLNINRRIKRFKKILELLKAGAPIADVLDSLNLVADEQKQLLNTLDSDIYRMAWKRTRFIILRLDTFLSDGGAHYAPKIMTIEHVLPQTVNSDSPWLEEWPEQSSRDLWIHKLANLVPLNKRRNILASNYGFEKKKTEYFAGKKNVSSYILTTQVLKSSRWTPSSVESRQQELLNVFCDNWGLPKADIK